MDESATNQPYKDSTVTWTIGQSLGVGLSAFLLPQILLGIVLALYSMATNSDINELFAEDNILLSFGISVFAGLTTTGIVMLFLKPKGFFRKVGFKKVKWDEFGLAIPGYLVYLVLALIVNMLFTAAYPELAGEEQDIGFTDAAGYEMFFAFLSLVVIAPLYEELLFRGFVFRGIAKATSFWPAALSVSFLFGVAHGQLNVAIDTFLVGVVASWLVWHTKSIWPAILLHGMKNLVAYLFIFVFEVNI